MNPNLFWSASEDGTVRQFDKRCRCLQQGSSCFEPLVPGSSRNRRSNTVDYVVPCCTCTLSNKAGASARS